MNVMFLADLPLIDTGALSMLLSFILAMLLFLIILEIAIYIYSSFAFMAIGKKAGHPKPGIAWIPIIGKPLLTAKIAKMSWWPILLLLGYFFTYIPVFGVYITYAFFIGFSIFSIIWMWKTYEAVGKPGWWSLMVLVPVAGFLMYFILIGVAAWSKEKPK